MVSLAASLSARRAWIEIEITCALGSGILSLSARRAWIEITPFLLFTAVFLVALRKESVDRNGGDNLHDLFVQLSLSARRAWIEISC